MRFSSINLANCLPGKNRSAHHKGAAYKDRLILHVPWQIPKLFTRLNRRARQDNPIHIAEINLLTATATAK